MRKLHVVCPVCTKFKRLPMPREIFEIDEGALLKLPIRKGVVCDHEFLVVIDYNFSIRDYEVPNRQHNLDGYFNKATSKDEAFEFSYF